MASYLAMGQEELFKEKQLLEEWLARFKAMGLKLDMSRGKPAADQLDLSMDMLSISDCIDDTGVDARNYGNLEGIPEARRFFAQMLGAEPEETFVGGNSSLQMMYFMMEFAWEKGFGLGAWGREEHPKFLCPAPGYDRHFRVSESFGFELVAVPMTPDGPDMGIVEELVRDKSVKGIWCIPIYSNPDGYVYSAATVERLAAMKCGAADFRIFWDNAYGVHHLTDEALGCPNLLQACRGAGNEDRALMFCSTSKITFAGAGVGAMAASKTNVGYYSQHLFPTTIGFDKMNQLRHARYLKDEKHLAAHMKKHAALLAPKFKVVLDCLHSNLDGCEVASWTEPKGGYFISLYTLDGCAKRVVEICKQAGVVLTGAGAAYPYGHDPADRHIRIAPTFPPLGELSQAAELLCLATRLASVEKLLAYPA